MLSFGMMRLFLCFVFCLSAAPAFAQLRIPAAAKKATIPAASIMDEVATRDTTIIGPIESGWARFTDKMAQNVVVGVFLALPDPGYPYSVVNWVLPFFGGTAESNQLAEATVSASVWENPQSLEGVVPDSAITSAPGVSLKAGAYETAWASFDFSGLPYWIGPRTVALAIRYDSGPDSMAVSPVWTDSERMNRYFYGMTVAESDTSTVDLILEHDDFWGRYEIDPSVFGELAGILIVDLDTTTVDDNPDGEAPIGTGLREEWYLPQSHAVVDNYPNPFNPETTIRVAAQGSGLHEVQIYDVLGRVVHQADFKGRAGELHEMRWSAGDLPSGAYWVSVKFADQRWIHAMTLRK